MPRRLLKGSANLVFHVMNRAPRRALLFDAAAAYLAFEHVLSEAGARVPMRLLAYTIMPNHWHLVVWPEHDDALSRYMQWLTRTHAQRWQLARGSVGTGAVYQGRYRAVPVQSDTHFLVACRYVEQNPVRAGLVTRASEWRWGSAWHGSALNRPSLAPGPLARPADWTRDADVDAGPEVETLRECTRRGVPYGATEWAQQTAARVGLTPHVRGRGRPRRANHDRRK